MKNDALIIWHPCEFASALKTVLGDNRVITSKNELSTAKFAEHSAIVLLVELPWDRKKLCGLYGIDLAREVLRADLKLKLPILFVSFLSLRQIRMDVSENEILDRQIVGTIGHDYLRLPSSPQQWFGLLAEMGTLTDLQLADVLNNSCDVKGLIGERIHLLKNQCRAILDNQKTNGAGKAKNLVIKVFDEIASLIGDRSEATAKKISLLTQLEPALKESAIGPFLTRSEEEFKSLILGCTRSETLRASDHSNRQPWKVLILDDEPDGLRQLLAALVARGIECVVVESVLEAEQKIGEDRSNEIVVAISDYRLLETVDGVRRHQRRQGYDFLLGLAKENRFNALVALSGLSRRFLLESFRKYNTRIEVYSKNDLRGEGAINLFADNILDLGIDQYEVMCSQPSAAEWQVLKKFYVAHRQAADYALSEQRISDDARRVALQIQMLLQHRDEEWLLIPELPKFENLQKRMTFRNSEQFKSLMPIFRNKLVARRLAIWLHLALGFDAVGILLALNGELLADRMLGEIKEDLRNKGDKKGPKWVELLDVNARNELKNRAKQPLTALAISLSDLPSNLLVEEKAWLAFRMGLDLSSQQAASEATFQWIQVGAEDWCQRNPSYAKQIAETMDFVGSNGKPAICSWDDGKKFLLAARSLLSTEGDRCEFEAMVHRIGNKISSESKAPALVEEFKDLAAQLTEANASATHLD